MGLKDNSKNCNLQGMKKKQPKKIAIFIAYDAEKTLEKFYKEFPKRLFDEIILVDDASKDKTYEIAKRYKSITSYKNPKNLGYGGNMKRALNLALKAKADIIVDIHPDGEYKTSAIPLAFKEIEKGSKLVLGNRFWILNQPLKSGMYIWKFIPIRLLNFIDKTILGVNINDFHQGFRVYTRELLKKVKYKQNSNNYLFSFEIITQAVFHKLKITEVPVKTKYKGKKRGASLKNSIKYTLGTFKILYLYILAKLGFQTKLFK